ncbi:hypothetical protein JW960_13095 [candidate division KSB1 bacterium]|nr:hypothetical protein [candidate division KSB1 bacterium]
MTQKSLIMPELRRTIHPPLAWVDRRFLFHGFFADLVPDELVLYFFLILVADRDGLSFYSYDKICQLLKMDVDSYINARNGLIRKQLIAFDNAVFQVLSLPQRQTRAQPTSLPTDSHQTDFQAMAQLFANLKQHKDP